MLCRFSAAAKDHGQNQSITYNALIAFAATAGIEDLREKREEVQKQIRDEECEKAKLQQDLQVLTKRLAHINDGLARKVCP